MAFDSLTDALAGWFEKPFSALPETLQQRVKRQILPSWDVLSPEQRRSAAWQWDYQHDPATEQDREFWWDFYQRMDEIKQEMATWEATAAPTASDRGRQEARLAELRQELRRMERKEANARADYLAQRRRELEARYAPADFIAYPQAFRLLSAHLEATPEEIAAWVWLGPEEGGLGAYRNANELTPPPRFYFDYEMGADYLAPLMKCWFVEQEIAEYQPADRFITGKALTERWHDRPGIHVEAFVRAKIAESRLTDFHPTMGATQWSEEENFPAKETALFAVGQVEAIERGDFGIIPQRTKPAGHLDHDPELQARANQIAADWITKNKRSITRNKVANILAKELEMDEATVLRRIRKQWK